MTYDFFAYSKVREGKPRLYRFLEMVPGVLALTVLIVLVVGSFLFPLWIAVAIILFDVYWLIKVLYLTVHLVSAYSKMRKHVRIAWDEKIRALPTTQQKKVYQLIIVPFVHESYEVLHSTFQALADSAFPHDQMIVALAAEDRAWDKSKATAERIAAEFGTRFLHFAVVRHPDGLPGEIRGKAANQSYAGAQMVAWVQQNNIPIDHTLASVFDADTVVHPQYFSCLAYHFLVNPHPLRRSYQPIPVFHNNVWDAPSIVRVVSASASFWQMMEQGQPEKMATFSSHSMPLRAVIDIGYWSKDAVSEDSRVYWQCIVRYRGDYGIQPLFFPVSMDTVLGDTYWSTLKNQYKQLRRWAWGAENIPYLLYAFLKYGKEFPLEVRLRYTFHLLEGGLTWATSSLIIGFIGWLPLLFGGDAFASTVFAQSVPAITSSLMRLALIGLIASSYVSIAVMPKRPRHRSRLQWIFVVLQWFLLPISTIVYGALPALDAQVRLMLGKYMGFWVTPKSRKSKEVYTAGVVQRP